MTHPDQEKTRALKDIARSLKSIAGSLEKLNRSIKIQEEAISTFAIPYENSHTQTPITKDENV